MHFSWLQVYDVTKFLEDHPGGDEVLLSATGMVDSAWTLFGSHILFVKQVSFVSRLRVDCGNQLMYRIGMENVLQVLMSN